MNTRIIKIILWATFPLFLGIRLVGSDPVYPVKVSENGRYFTDQNGTPVFWLGTTQWQLFRAFTLEEARIILEKSKEKGFVFVQVKLLGQGDGTNPNIYGEQPWIDNNPLTPNEAYFKKIDDIIKIARENNIIISMSIYHKSYKKYITVENGREWAKWIAQRYHTMPNIVWSTTPEAKTEYIPVLDEMAKGILEADKGSHPITSKPDPSPFSSSFIHEKTWLDYNSSQVWKDIQLIYPMVTNDYNLKPVKPVLMAEGAYEQGSEYGFDVTPLWIRRQAYYSYLTGGHHAYGHNDSWRVLPTWKQALDAPGAVQLGILKKIFLDRKAWWYLVPDQTVFASGGNTEGQILNLAARHKDGQWIMVYLGSKTTFSIKMDAVTAGKSIKAFWVDPKTGKSEVIGNFKNTGVKSFSTPDDWEDALLILEASSRL